MRNIYIREKDKKWHLEEKGVGEEKIKVEKRDMGPYDSNCPSELPAVSQELTRYPREMCEVQETLPQHQGLHPDIDPKP